MRIERGVWATAAAAAMCVGVAVGSARAAEKVPTPIVDITNEYTDRVVTVRGRLASERAFKSGVRYVVKDDSGEITLVVFDRAKRGAPELKVGATIEATGKVDFYKEAVQLVPARGVDLKVLAPPPPPEPPVLMHTLSEADRGRRVTVSGTVVDALHFTAGFKYVLDDGSGRVQLVLFERVYDRLKQPELLSIGSVVTATGEVDVFAEAVQVAPGNAEDMQIVGGSREVREYQLGRLSGNDHNAVVRVSGAIDNVQAVRGGVEWSLKDATGVQKVRLDTVVVERLATSLRENPLGARVVVIGRLRASRANGLRIDVILPTDVQPITQSAEVTKTESSRLAAEP
jgi:DNA/RNA endonuclease YhcR with UshA esterase domain